MPVCQVLPGHEGKEGGKTELEDVRKMLAGTLRASTGGGMKRGGIHMTMKKKVHSTGKSRGSRV